MKQLFGFVVAVILICLFVWALQFGHMDRIITEMVFYCGLAGLWILLCYFVHKRIRKIPFVETFLAVALILLALPCAYVLIAVSAEVLDWIHRTNMNAYFEPNADTNHIEVIFPDGTKHLFPSDAKPEEIQKALSLGGNK